MTGGTLERIGGVDAKGHAIWSEDNTEMPNVTAYELELGMRK